MKAKMKRRRVDLSCRVAEAKDVAAALEEWLGWAREAGTPAPRVRRFLTQLERGIEYVVETLHTAPRGR